jgi:AraC family transcriptional regulator of adaptative response / DNA-3-methyladenine glycosylase II
MRRSRASTAPVDRLQFDLAFRPPYDWESMLAFLGKRAIGGVEVVEGRVYRRTLRSGKAVGWVQVTLAPRRPALRVTMSTCLAGSIPNVLARVKQLFDLACRPDEIAAALGPLAAARPGLRLPGAIDGFEVAVRAILGQQVTVHAATTIAGRFARAFGERIETRHAGLDTLFPTPAAVAQLAESDVASKGIIASRARAIVALARAMEGGRLRLEPTADVDATLATLRTVPGIGPWTAEYIAMRALAWPDAFPHPDVAALKAMKLTGAKALAAAEAWRPWRGYAVIHLWKSLEESK